jgi:hypothetical protein
MGNVSGTRHKRKKGKCDQRINDRDGMYHTLMILISQNLGTHKTPKTAIG